ncbi:LPXTG-motif cell wall anchor domain-containing protein [Pseudobutyrivibrio sp. OR37]|uniref:SpaA isopeptide-forming pilin-related protein n=1 Tax=Pseudobutyrivibrio sp. OR37 TaxID=1798186 RepID=UPI0008E8E293|nr:SpaA isopeptide-forming pilin-related protein [Pseudobutyrivibrio sp. OR37]SFH52734.1 LPXTG-motif cell wall anchor domain-containing protein [Pseudobutyrivibrio sp. OR37]
MGKRLVKRILAGTLAAIFLTAMVPVSISENLFGGIGKVEAASVSYIPMTIASGFNADVIMDSGETLNNQAAADQMNNLSVGGNCFYSASYSSSGGLPTNKVVPDKSGSVSGLSWTLGDYKAKNDMRLSPGSSATFTFNTVGVYQKVYFLVTAGGIPGGSATMNTTINYSSGSASTSKFTVVDWYSSTSYANASFMRVSADGINGSTTSGPYFTRCVMNLDTTRLVNSITIKNTASSGVINVYAVTGVTAAVAAPTNLKLEGCAALNATWDAVTGAASYRIDIAKDKNFTQIVGDYNNKSVSTNSCQVKGLATGVQYYARIRAVDKDGGQGPSSVVVNCESNYSFAYSAVDNRFKAHCTIDGCEYDKDHEMEYELEAQDTVYNRQPVPATLKDTNASFLTAATGYSVGEINYYKTNSYGSTSESGATSLGTTAPRDVGYYFAKVTFTKDSSTYSIVKPFKIYLEDANYAQEKLNNVYDEEQQSTIEKVRGDSAVSNLRVVLNNSEDKIKIYKIADMFYNDNNRDYDDMTWDTDAVLAWLSASGYGSDNTYSAPKNIDSMTDALKNQFYKDMLTEEVKEATLVRDTSASELLNGDDVTSALNEADGSYYAYFNDMNFGRYMIVATNSGGTSYTPVVIDIIPYQNGPHTDWYVINEFTAYLKEIVATIDKSINGHDVSDTINFGDEVFFKVDATLPSMYADRATVGGNEYTLQMVDTMSSSFALTEAEPYLTYSIDSANVHYDNVPFELGKEYPYYVFSDSPVTGGTEITKDNEADYSYDGSADLVGMYALPQMGTLYSIGHNVNESGITEIVVNFNVSALKAYLKTLKATAGVSPSEVVVSLNYTATVTNAVEVGSDNNTNTAKILFEKSTGEVDSTEDTVRGYTYGLQVIKKDGGREDTFLAGAQFRIYKEGDIFLKAEASDAYTWKKRVGSEATETPSDVVNVDEAMAAFEEAGLSSNYYILTEEYGESGTTEDGIAYAAGDTIVRVFNLYTKAINNTANNSVIESGEFVSVANANGVALSGLSEGNYILAEVKAPNGYNELAEDIMFTIYRMEDSEAAQYYQGSLKNFYEPGDEAGTKKLNESSMVSLTVLNYQGLVLPSTGGIGTLIFTIIGIILMGTVILLFVIKKHRSGEDYM